MANGGKSLSTQYRTGLFQAEKWGGWGGVLEKGLKKAEVRVLGWAQIQT